MVQQLVVTGKHDVPADDSIMGHRILRIINCSRMLRLLSYVQLDVKSHISRSYYVQQDAKKRVL